MKITKINTPIKCDSILCYQNATIEIAANSYKGNQYLCDNCFENYKNLFKQVRQTSEKK